MAYDGASNRLRTFRDDGGDGRINEVQRLVSIISAFRAEKIIADAENCWLADSPHGVLAKYDELSGWFGSMGKYNSGKGSAADRAFWLEGYNGAPKASAGK